jgi:hypothetical protein
MYLRALLLSVMLFNQFAYLSVHQKNGSDVQFYRYVDEDAGFSIEIPTTTQVEVFNNTNHIALREFTWPIPNSVEQPLPKLSIVAERMEKGISYQDWLAIQQQITVGYVLSVTSSRIVVVDGAQGTWRHISADGYLIQEVELVRGDVIYRVSQEYTLEADPVFSSIVSSIHFQEPNNLVETIYRFAESSTNETGMKSMKVGAFPNLKFPFNGTKQITCAYYRDDTDCHEMSKLALDFGMKYEIVYAAHSGTVLTKSDACSGNILEITDKDDRSYKTGYVHLSKFLVANGSAVVQGQAIAVSGATGTCLNAPHLHFNVLQNGLFVLPEPICGKTGFKRGQYQTSCWDSPPETTPPTIRITSPAIGSVIYPGSVSYTVDASDNAGGSGMNFVEFYVNYNNNWNLVYTDYDAPYGFSWTTPAGLNSQQIAFSAHAYDKGGNHTIAPDGRWLQFVSTQPTPTPQPAPGYNNLLVNGDFGNGTTNWWRWQDADYAVWDGILATKRSLRGGGGSVGQDLPYYANEGSSFQIQLRMGNPSSVTKTPTVALRNKNSWDGAIKCIFTLAPNTPMRNFLVRGKTAFGKWDELRVEIVPDPADDVSDLRVDDVHVAYRPDMNFAHECWMENLQPNPPTPVSPANTGVVPLSAVTLQVNDAGDPDNQPNNYRNYNFTIAALDNSWSSTSGWILPNS